ncbi:MAG: lysophospholipid acyltransferase family protein [candidate division KSB1 bacterium]|nr:lysophospholipid acyltransferase family protein [candidate division KSB1 bacterium]MDZ7376901.1 lysophospholipid acyltransferase family protein [candidate division KSB1 bacterium]
MIKANPTRWAKFVFHIYVMRLMKRQFHAFHLFGDLPQPDPNLPLLLIPNHSTWWDGFFVYLLNDQILKREPYLMMLDRQLAKYRFFARIGAFGITPGDRENVNESLNYTVELLQKKNVMITIFPQGILLPWGKRPLNFKKGIEAIIQLYKKPINILPLAIRAEYGGEQRAEVFFQFGQNLIVDTDSFQGVKWLESIELGLLDDLAEKIHRGEKGRQILIGKRSINVKMDRLFGRK